MIFSSIQYFIFLPVVVFLYWRLRGPSRLLLVVASSYFFYMSWMPIYGLLLFALSSIAWLLGIAIDRFREKQPLQAKTILIAGIVLNLLCLTYYKYSNFILANSCSFFNFVAQHLHLANEAVLKSPYLQIILPLGISFFVFEFIHYLVDVYKGSKSVRSWMEFSAFAAFFPSQIAGPIKRYQEFEENLRNPLPWSKELFYEGMTLIAQGLFKKVAIADPIAWVIASSYQATQAISGVDAWLAFVGFSIQIFCDFSGYTDMGRGSALLLGIRLPINFQVPYISEDISLFWRRWHISLSSWIRDYVYIPMGGSRCSYLAGLKNLFLTMAICGLWHGAAWQFIIWGAMHGLALIINRLWKSLLDRFDTAKQILSFPAMRALNVVLTFLFVAACFVMFRAPNMRITMNIFSSLLNFHMESNTMELLIRTGVPVFGSVYLGFWILTEILKNKKGLKLPSQLVFPLHVRLAAWTATLLFIFSARPNQVTPFIYFQF